MDSRKKTARLAGFTYLIVILTGILYLQYIPSQLKIRGNIPKLMQDIPAFERIFKLGILAEITCWVFFLILPIILYRLFKPVNELWAKMMVVFAIVQVPISFMNILNKLAILSLMSDTQYLKIYSMDQLHSQVLFYLNLYHQGNLINHVFWGLWLLPFGYLVYRSQFLPKILGILLIAGCFGYVIDFLGTFLFPGYDDTAIPNYIILPASIGEIGICLWMMIVGVKNNV